ncbi:MAG: pre-peptidase C-terminal domain-containing protein, partial [Deltaproteobacteria bacterium]|nr:pre-peptidase C-terminal domain-containing protein [Deltaproteobacteria bacterium]
RFVVTGGAGGNQPPVFATIPSQEVSVGKTLVLTVQATDPDGDPLAYGVEDAPPGSAWDAAGHTLTFTPAAGVANQSFTPTFSASDGTFTVTKQAAILVKAGGAPATCSPDAFEPNEDKAAAAKLNPGLFQGLSICDPDASSFDADWFSLQLTAGTHLTATITFSHDHGDLGLGLFAATGQQALALSDGVSDLESVATTVPAAGTFYLVVFAKAGVNLKVPYSLEINAAAGGGCSADLLEPNDSLAEALPLLPEDFVDGIRICPGDEDWFSLDLTAGESLIATIDFPVDKDLDLYLYGPAGQSLDSSLSGAGLETVAVDPAPATGTYAVKVVGWPPESTQADYSLEVMASTCPACDGDWKEPNDSQGQAGLLVPGQAVQDLTICCDADWFQFNVSQGKQVQVELEYATDALTKPSVALTLPATAAVPVPCGPDTCLGGSVAGTAGTAYLQVTGPANTWYEVLVTVSGAAAGDSCAGHCDDQAPGGCWCDGTCLEYNDCCDDVCDACPAVCG